MDKSIRMGWIIAIGLILLFFGSWAITATLTGNPVTVKSYDTLESELVKEDYRGTYAFVLILVLIIALGVAFLIVPFVKRNQYSNALLWGIAGFILLGGIYSGTEPYTFEIGIVEQDAFNKPAMPLRGQLLFFSIWVVGMVSFVLLWFDMRRQRTARFKDEETIQYQVQDGSEQNLNL